MRASSLPFRRLAASALAVLAASSAGSAFAQQPMGPSSAPACPATLAALPPAFAAWSNATTLESATDRPGLAMTKIAPGEAEALTLHPMAEVHYALPPQKPAAPGTFGGMVALHVTTAGTYRVALSAPAWVDLVSAGAALPTTAHGHGPDCSGIRKIIDFALQPGDHVVQIVGNATSTITVLVVPQG